jgi:hypothetical protein
MNYTIIGYIEGVVGYRNGYREYDEDVEAVLDIKTFRDDQKAEFLQAWAHQSVNSTYDKFEILLNGIGNDLTDEEYEVYNDLEREMMNEYYQPAKDARAAEIAAKKERDAQAALAQARLIAARQRAEDERQYQLLQRKLGL